MPTAVACSQCQQRFAAPDELAGRTVKCPNCSAAVSYTHLSDYVAERLARTYVGTENGPFILYRRRRFVTWLSDRLNQQDLAYDEIVRALISGDGLWTDSPEVNFVTVTSVESNENQPDNIRLAGRTVRAFLGTRIDCLQCHDENRTEDPSIFPDGDGDTRDGTQRDFHRLAAFYSETQNSLRGIQDTKDQPYNYKFLYEEEEETVEPGVPFNVELLEEEGTRRQRLANWVTHPRNRPFARAMVNRIWALMFGRALHDPIDNMDKGFPSLRADLATVMKHVNQLDAATTKEEFDNAVKQALIAFLRATGALPKQPQ